MCDPSFFDHVLVVIHIYVQTSKPTKSYSKKVSCLRLCLYIGFFFSLKTGFLMNNMHHERPHKMKHASEKRVCFASLQADAPQCQQEDCGRCPCRPLRHAGKRFLSALEHLFPAAGLEKNGAPHFLAISESPALTSSFPVLHWSLVPPELPPTDATEALEGRQNKSWTLD